MSFPQRMVRPPTAFSLSSTRKKHPRIKNGDHLKWIRTLPCILTGSHAQVEAAHIRYGDPVYGKRETGNSEKSDDRWTVPLNATDHRQGPDSQHGNNERGWWASKGIDPLQVASALWGVTGDTELAEVILREAREKYLTFVRPGKTER